MRRRGGLKQEREPMGDKEGKRGREEEIEEGTMVYGGEEGDLRKEKDVWGICMS